MTTQHTPGPWIFGTRGDEMPIEKPFDYCGPGYYDNPAIFGSDGSEVAGCDEYMIFNNEADVRLIVAAPDLLDALQEIARTTDFWSQYPPEHPYGKARDAIAKATGQA